MRQRNYGNYCHNHKALDWRASAWMEARAGAERCRTKAPHAAHQSARLHPTDADTHARAHARTRAHSETDRRVTGRDDSYSSSFLKAFSSGVIPFPCLRSDGDLHGGEGGGDPVRGEQRALRRHEQSRKVVRNGRYAQHFIYCPALNVNGLPVTPPPPKKRRWKENAIAPISSFPGNFWISI